MKKIILSLLIIFTFLIVFSNRVGAQEKLTCKEWLDIYKANASSPEGIGLPKCPHPIWKATRGGVLWCAASREEFMSVTDERGSWIYTDVNAPKYTFDFDFEECMASFDEKGFQSSAVSGPSVTKEGKPESFLFAEESDFLETFRKLLEVLPNPREILDRARKGGVSQTKIEQLVSADLLERLPYITPSDEQKVWDSLANFTSSAQNDIIVVKGKIKVKSPTLDDFIQVVPEGKPVFVTYLDAVITAADPEPTQLGYPWGSDTGAVISIPQSTEIELGAITKSVKLNQGEVEVKIQNNDPQNPFNVHSGSLTVVAPRTHFWVSQDPDKKQTVVGVYQGEVQVTTQDGQTTSVVPSGDPSTGSGQGKPGVVVVTQKLSPVKLVIAGVVLAGVIGGAIFILKKRFSSNSFKKKK